MAAAQAARKGSYYKTKTKKWLQSRGRQVADMELYRRISDRGGIKVDQFGSDLLAMDAAELIFVQVKGGKDATHQVAKACRAFGEFTFPTFVRLWIVCWPHRARAPRVWEVDPDVMDGYFEIETP